MRVPDDLVTVDLGDLYPALKGERIRGRLQGRRVTPYPDRAQLADGKLLAGKEIVWLDSAAGCVLPADTGFGPRAPAGRQHAAAVLRRCEWPAVPLHRQVPGRQRAR